MPDALQQIEQQRNDVATEMESMSANASKLASDLAAAAQFLRSTDFWSIIMSKADDLVESLVARLHDQKTEIDKLNAESVLSDKTVADATQALTDTAPPAPAPAPDPNAPPAAAV